VKNVQPYFVSDIVEYLGELFFDEDGGVGSWVNNPNTVFSILVKVCDNVVELYLEQLFASSRLKIKHLKVNHNNVHQLVAQRLHEDTEAFAEVFLCDNLDLGKLQRRYERQAQRQNKALKARLDKIRVVGDLFAADAISDPQIEAALDAFGEDAKTFIERVMDLRSLKKDKGKTFKRLHQIINSRQLQND